MKTLTKILLPAFAAFALAGCGGPLFSVFPRDSGNAPTRQFVLSSEVAAGTELPDVTFARITIPAYLDVPQIVTREGNEISRSEKDRWGEPLARGVARVLALRCAVVASARGVKPAPTERVSVAIERFDGRPDGNVEISARYALIPKAESGAKAVEFRLFRASVPVSAPNDYAAYVRALDAALSALAEDIVSRFVDEK